MNEKKYLVVPFGLKVLGTMKLVFAFLLATTALGAFHMIGGDVGEAVEQAVIMLHLDPKKHIINEALEKLSGVDARQLKQIGAGTLFYSLLYVIEGVGLIRGKHWAEYMVITITGSLLPLEIYEVVEKLSAVRMGVLMLNLVTLSYLIWRIRRDKQVAKVKQRVRQEIEELEHAPQLPLP